MSGDLNGKNMDGPDSFWIPKGFQHGDAWRTTELTEFFMTKRGAIQALGVCECLSFSVCPVVSALLRVKILPLPERSPSCQRWRGRKLTVKERAALNSVAAMPDSAIDTSDSPEVRTGRARSEARCIVR
jgi:hypothetical protein